MNTVNNNGASNLTPYHEELSARNERFHRETIYQLEKTLVEDPACVEAIGNWIDSYHQLAAIYQEKGNLDMAQQCLYIAHQSMLYMAQHSQDDSDEKLIAMKAINLTLPALIAFAEIHPPCEHCMEALQAQLALIEHNNETHH